MLRILRKYFLDISRHSWAIFCLSAKRIIASVARCNVSRWKPQGNHRLPLIFKVLPPALRYYTAPIYTYWYIVNDIYKALHSPNNGTMEGQKDKCKKVINLLLHLTRISLSADTVNSYFALYKLTHFSSFNSWYK